MEQNTGTRRLSGPGVKIADDIVIGEEVVFEAGGLPLAGSVLKPAGDGHHPAVVMLVGSGSYSYRPSWREGNFPFWKTIAETFVDKGYVALMLEKRGVNRSAGRWQAQSFADRAADAGAALAYLRTRPDVDARCVGVCGHSQGGWIAQLAAATYPDVVAFCVLLAGPSVTVKQQVIDDMANDWRCAGMPETEVAKRMRRTAVQFAVLGAAARVVKIGYMSRILNYDPAGVAARIRCPILAVYGQNDYLVVPETNTALLRAELERQGHSGYRIVVIPGANHGFMLSGKCFKWEELEPRFAPGFLEALKDWQPWFGGQLDALA